MGWQTGRWADRTHSSHLDVSQIGFLATEIDWDQKRAEVEILSVGVKADRAHSIRELREVEFLTKTCAEKLTIGCFGSSTELSPFGQSTDRLSFEYQTSQGVYAMIRYHPIYHEDERGTRGLIECACAAMQITRVELPKAYERLCNRYLTWRH